VSVVAAGWKIGSDSERFGMLCGNINATASKADSALPLVNLMNIALGAREACGPEPAAVKNGRKTCATPLQKRITNLYWGDTHLHMRPPTNEFDTDKFADLERWEEGNIILITPKQPSMLRYEYVRFALKQGLRHEVRSEWPAPGAGGRGAGLSGLTSADTGELSYNLGS